ncbi:MAG: glycosyltransferase, partial [Lachnospiraceae bacterium]|nr:glycosyltransferase [Lachnospiraceae bacterium]
MEPFFSIIIVCFQAGEELDRTVESVRMQTDGDFEILVKDGGSTDGSIGHLPEDSRIRLFQEKDSGIYDAMNQAAGRVRGRYVLFLNCGDYLYDKEVLAGVRKAVTESAEQTTGGGRAVGGLPPVIFYGNTYERKTQSVV